MPLKNINPHLKDLDVDYLYHLGLDTSMDLKAIFGDTKFVIMQGSPVRAKTFALKLAREFGFCKEEEVEPIGKAERFSLFKVGPIVSVSHGMGEPSMSILLHEVAKLMAYCDVEDPVFIRCGTSGGLGLEPGSVVVCNEGLNSNLENQLSIAVLGKTVHRPAVLDAGVCDGLVTNAPKDVNCVIGKTMSCECFYETQGRLDGFFCDYTNEDKMDFLKRAFDVGCRNIEMEACYFAAFCYKAKIRGSVVCCTLLDRLKGDQVTSTPAQLAGYAENAQNTIIAYMKSVLA
eukprot:TRINITY_DN779899_c0_g1_i1.p1 TRINITY_DN779899_c0_g1~~TRINITY_DN779899_c0_g1_i1.p1  ORF type:complete len:288 (+),score=82.69 TRINITY_DN779899_c0_g1_i1:64-927(+)